MRISALISWKPPCCTDDAGVIVENALHFDGGSLATYREMIAALDRNIGKVLAALDASGRARDTIVGLRSKARAAYEPFRDHAALRPDRRDPAAAPPGELMVRRQQVKQGRVQRAGQRMTLTAT